MGDMLPEPVGRMAAAMATDEKRPLARALVRMVAEELAAGDGDEPGECPLCHHGHLVRKGRGRDGSQGWRCKGAGA